LASVSSALVDKISMERLVLNESADHVKCPNGLVVREDVARIPHHDLFEIVNLPRVAGNVIAHLPYLTLSSPVSSSSLPFQVGEELFSLGISNDDINLTTVNHHFIVVVKQCFQPWPDRLWNVFGEMFIDVIVNIIVDHVADMNGFSGLGISQVLGVIGENIWLALQEVIVHKIEACPRAKEFNHPIEQCCRLSPPALLDVLLCNLAHAGQGIPVSFIHQSSLEEEVSVVHLMDRVSQTIPNGQALQLDPGVGGILVHFMNLVSNRWNVFASIRLSSDVKVTLFNLLKNDEELTQSLVEFICHLGLISGKTFLALSETEPSAGRLINVEDIWWLSVEMFCL